MKNEKRKSLNLYIPPGYMERISEVAKMLDAQGVDIYDNRGGLSISKIFRYFIDRELDNSK
jgi:hypothetical protein